MKGCGRASHSSGLFTAPRDRYGFARAVLAVFKKRQGDSAVGHFGCKLAATVRALFRGWVLLAVAAVPLALSSARAPAASTVTVAITSDFVSRNPYGDSSAQTFGIWCQIYGCLAAYDTATGTLKSLLAETWAQDPNDLSSWIITLRKGLKRH